LLLPFKSLPLLILEDSRERLRLERFNAEEEGAVLLCPASSAAVVGRGGDGGRRGALAAAAAAGAPAGAVVGVQEEAAVPAVVTKGVDTAAAAATRDGFAATAAAAATTAGAAALLSRPVEECSFFSVGLGVAVPFFFLSSSRFCVDLLSVANGVMAFGVFTTINAGATKTGVFTATGAVGSVTYSVC
jgi:hypothetical protein